MVQKNKKCSLNLKMYFRMHFLQHTNAQHGFTLQSFSGKSGNRLDQVTEVYEPSLHSDPLSRAD